GVLVLVALFRRFSTEIRTRIDRGAGKIDVKGRRWLSKSWHVTRSIGELASIDVCSRIGPYAERYYGLLARFTDGSTALVGARNAVRLQAIEERLGEFKAFLEGAAWGWKYPP